MGSRMTHDSLHSRRLDCSADSSLHRITGGHITALNPKKRRRVSLPRIDVRQTISEDTRAVLSAREGGQTRVDDFDSREAEQDDHVAVAGRARRSKKIGPVISEARGAQFIQEPFSFPERQIWLKTKPRQRRGAAAAAVQDVVLPSQEAPGEGETLSLAKHADHIAALIARKRLENESRSFRERMVLQQRLYRGEEDVHDKLIAAGHNELKRKMELSARGIYEERPPGESRNEESERDVSEQPMSPNSANSESPIQLESRRSQDQADNARSSGVSGSASTPDTRRTSEQSSPEIDEADSAVLGAESNSLMTPLTVHHHMQHTTTQSITLTTTSAYPHPPSLYLAQPRFSNQRTYNTQLQTTEQFPAMQDWTAHMWRALPSTATPILARSTVILPSAHTPQQSVSIDRPSRVHNSEESVNVHQQRDNLGLPAAPTSVPDSSTFHIANDNSSMLARSVEVAQNDPSAATNRLNRNMFTGKAREDMLIANSNHYAEPERRRNMFSNRP